MKRKMDYLARVNELRKWDDADIEQIIVAGFVSLAARDGCSERSMILKCLQKHDAVLAEVMSGVTQ